MKYSLVSYSVESRVAVIQVNDCTKQTSIDVPYGMNQGDQEFLDLMDQETQKVLDNMDPASPTYDPALVGGQ